MPDRDKELSKKEINRHTDKEADNTHEVFRNKEYEEYDRSRDFKRLTDNSRIEEIAFECMDNKKHRNNRDNNTPAWVFYHSGKENRNTSDKDAQNRNETREKCDTSESK